MPDIRYVCLSDLHFGAENSILSRLVEGGVVVDTTAPSSVMQALVRALRTLIDQNEDRTRRPTLILNGDVLELALASDNVALMVLERFLDLAFPSDSDALFDPTILYQPGNHDHHLWETARERQYGDHLRSLAPDAPLPIPWHATRLYPENATLAVQAEVLDQLARRRPHRAEVNFQVSYPNMGLRSADEKTTIVFHHGHFVESMYHLMTTLKDLVFPDRVEPKQLWDLEAENFAWIDFFWSTLGRSGDVGEDVGLIYDMLQSAEAIDVAARNVALGISERLPRSGMLGRLRWLLRPILFRALRAGASHVAASERRMPLAALSPKADTGLMTYLSGPLLSQLAIESPHGDGALPEQVKFVFGHTHKPFTAVRNVPGLRQPVRLFNTGGWVVDTLAVEPLGGANLVLIDEALEVACVRLFNQAAEPSAYRVRLDDGVPAEHGPFYRRLSGLIRPDDEVWTSFSAATAALIAERRQALSTIITNAGRPSPTSPFSTRKAPSR